jgi:inosine-uridine nucleoside N-ribohydrolase
VSRPTRVIIDTDAGIDDALALALAALSPELNLTAVTTTYGNATLTETTQNARHVLRLAGRHHIPVQPGAARPLRRSFTPPETHGPAGAGFACVPRPEAGQYVPNPLVLAQVLEKATEPVVLVTLGPLTNLANALSTAEEVVRETLSAHVAVLGTSNARGARDRAADFNAWADPEAAHQVVQSGLPTQAIGLDVCRRVLLTSGAVQALANSHEPLVRWLGEALRFAVESHRARFGVDGCYPNDALAIASLVHPDLLDFETRLVRVNLDEGDERGHTTEAATGSPLQMAARIDAKRSRRLLGRVFGTAWLSEQGNRT